MIELLALPAIYGALVAWGIGHANRKRLEAWRVDVERCGLRLERMSLPGVYRLRLLASGGPIGVRIESIYRKGYGIATVHVTFPSPPGFAGVSIRRETSKTSVREIELGDPEFDETFSIEGPRRLIFTLLDEEVRRYLCSLNAACVFQLANGEIQARMSDPQLGRVLAQLLTLCRRFGDEPGDIASRLADNARRDSHSEARLNNLLLLARELPGDPRTLEALRLACADPQPRNRLRAAREAGVEGRAVLLELAEGLADDRYSAQAVALLGAESGFERLRAILIGALRRRRVRTARTCLEALGRVGGAEAVVVLSKVLARERGELAAAAAGALGEAGDPASEPALIGALQRESIEIRVAAANALARLGSAAAVLPLKEAAEGAGGAPELRKATRQAVAEIQARLQGVSGALPGQLSLADAEAGQLSLVDADTGQLSLAADDPAGRLSLPDQNGETGGGVKSLTVGDLDRAPDVEGRRGPVGHERQIPSRL